MNLIFWQPQAIQRHKPHQTAKMATKVMAVIAVLVAAVAIYVFTH